MDQSLNVNGRPPYLIISVLMVGAFIAFLNNTLLNVALPTIMNEFHVEMADVQWLTTAYMLVNGIMIPTTAFLIQKYSVRRLFLTAIGLFTIGTFIAAVTPSLMILIMARMVQASGSAIMMPLLMNVMLVSFPVEKRGTAMGVFGLILMFAPAIGPTLSGWIIEHFDWRALFYLVAPIATVILILGFILLKDKKERVNIHLDVISLVLSSIGFGGLLYGFSSAADLGWGNLIIISTISIGAISLILFIIRQSRLSRPMLNFGVFKYPMFSLASVITMVVNMAMFSGFLLLPTYVQTIKGISPMDAGLMLLPGAILNAFMSPITGRLFDKFGGKILALVGLTILTITTFLFSDLTFETDYTYLMVLHAARMFGLSMVMMPVSTNGLNQLPREFYPHGTAMNNTLNQVAAAIGTAVLITVMTIRQDFYMSRLIEEALQSGISETQLAGMQVQMTAEAMLGGINDAFLASAYLAGAAIILAFFIKRARPADEKKVQGKLAPENG